MFRSHTVSHDRKSRLVTIGGFLSHLKRDEFAGNVELIEDEIVEIGTPVNQMQRLLGELLDLSRIGQVEW